MSTNTTEAAEQSNNPQKQQLPSLEDFTSPYLTQARSLLAPSPTQYGPYITNNEDVLPDLRRISSEHPTHKQINLDLIHLHHRLKYVAWMPHAYPWGNLPHGTTVADVGGSDGVACIVLAQAFPHLKFVVQDLPGRSDTSLVDASAPDVKNRIQFQTYNLLAPQPVKGADVYFFKNVLGVKILSTNDDVDDASLELLLHNAEIIRAQSPALTHGSRLLIMHPLDYRDVEVPEHESHRNADLVTVKICRAIDRMVEDTKALFEAGTDTSVKLPWVPGLPKSSTVEPVPAVNEVELPKGRFRWGGVYGLKESLYTIGEGTWEAN